MNCYTESYTKSLVAATPDDQLVAGKARKPRGLTEEQRSLMQHESEKLDRDFRRIEQSYAADHLDLTFAVAYVAHLLENARVVRHLAQHHGDVFTEFQKIAEYRKAA